MAIRKRTRYEVLRRDNFKCRYCGLAGPESAGLTMDHVVPVSLGGSDDPANLVAACKDCNAGKASSSPDAPLVAQVSDDAVRWAAAMKAAVEDMAVSTRVRREYRDAFLDEWLTWDKELAHLSNSWSSSVSAWHDVGLPIEVLLDCLDIAWSRERIPLRDRFRYMAGIAWKRVTELQEAARQSLTPPPPATCGHCEACSYTAAFPADADDEPWICLNIDPDLEDGELPTCYACGTPGCLGAHGYERGKQDGWREGFDQGIDLEEGRSAYRYGGDVRGMSALRIAIDSHPGDLNLHPKDRDESLASLQKAIDGGTFHGLIEAAARRNGFCFSAPAPAGDYQGEESSAA